MAMLARKWLNANVQCCLTVAGCCLYFEIWPDVPPNCHHTLSFQFFGKQWNDNDLLDSLRLDLQHKTLQYDITLAFTLHTMSTIPEDNGYHVNMFC